MIALAQAFVSNEIRSRVVAVFLTASDTLNLLDVS
jgi:hypothetical protein